MLPPPDLASAAWLRNQLGAWSEADLLEQAGAWSRECRTPLPDFGRSLVRAREAVARTAGQGSAELLRAHGIGLVWQDVPFVGITQAQAGVLLRAVLDLRAARLTIFRDAKDEALAAFTWCGVQLEGDLDELVLAHEAYHLLARDHEGCADECAAHLYATLRCGWRLFAGLVDLVVLRHRSHLELTRARAVEPLPP